MIIVKNASAILPSLTLWIFQQNTVYQPYVTCRGFINDKVVQIRIPFKKHNNKLLHVIFVMCRMINVEVRVTLTETLIILHITKTDPIIVLL